MELENIVDLESKFIIETLQKEIVELKKALIFAKIEHPIIEEIEKKTEKLICETEIERLQQTSSNRSLTLEETKRLDLLVKNLLLCKGAYKDIKPDYRSI